MAQISVSLPADGETIDAADYNTPINTIINDYNNNIDNSNIAAGAAIAGSKLADGGITNAKLSTSAGELGGAWATWTPTWANFTLGNGTVTAKYYTSGKTISGYIKVVLGSTSSMGTAPTFTAPVTAASQYGAQRNPVGDGHIQVAGSNHYVGGIEFNASTTVISITSTNVAGSYANPNSISATIPTSGWTTNDYFSFNFEYESA